MSLKAIEIINQINAQGHSLQQFTTDVISYLREQMLINLTNSEEISVIIGFIEIFSDAKIKITQAIIPQLALEIAVVKACDFGILENKEVDEVKVKSKKPNTEEKADKSKVSDISSSKSVEIEDKPSERKEMSELDLNEVKENWQRIIDNIETPFVRMSFIDSEPTKLENGTLHLSFNSGTFMDKIANSSNQAVVQKAFETVLGSKMNLKLEIKKLSLNTEDKKNENSADSSIIEMANEVFGNKN